MDYQYDLIVIGAGPGGYEAALFAAKKGMKVCLVEKNAVGGTCLNKGCIPTKSILHQLEENRIDLEEIQREKNEVVTALQNGILTLLKSAKVELITGNARVVDGHHVEVNDQLISTCNILVATGSVPAFVPIEGIDLPGIMTSDELLENTKPLDQLVIIGGGVIGVEFASIYARLNTHVTILEAADRLLPTMDKEISQNLKMIFKKRGIEVITGCKVMKIEEGYKITYQEKEETKTIDTKNILVATGRKANTQCIDDLGLTKNRGFITVDDQYRTQIDSIYAIGDVIGNIQLAHVATAEGLNAVCAMLGTDPIKKIDAVPSCVYTDPEIATVGLSLDQAKELGIDAKAIKILLSSNGKSVLTHQERSFVKIVVENETEKIIGASMMCARATDMISYFTLCIVNGLKKDQLTEIIWPHPTFSEVLGEIL